MVAKAKVEGRAVSPLQIRGSLPRQEKGPESNIRAAAMSPSTLDHGLPAPAQPAQGTMELPASNISPQSELACMATPAWHVTSPGQTASSSNWRLERFLAMARQKPQQAAKEARIPHNRGPRLRPQWLLGLVALVSLLLGGLEVEMVPKQPHLLQQEGAASVQPARVEYHRSRPSQLRHMLPVLQSWRHSWTSRCCVEVCPSLRSSFWSKKQQLGRRWPKASWQRWGSQQQLFGARFCPPPQHQEHWATVAGLLCLPGSSF